MERVQEVDRIAELVHEEDLMLTMNGARDILYEWTEGKSLRNHARAVEVVMARSAYAYGRGASDEEAFRIAGLLHDADYERWPDEHPRRIVTRMEQLGELAIAHAIAAHYSKWGVSCESALDRALLAVDELTGFVVACARLQPEGLSHLTSPSVLKKLKVKSFAAKVERDEIWLGAKLLGANLDDHIQLVIEALRPHAVEIGIRSSSGFRPDLGEELP